MIISKTSWCRKAVINGLQLVRNICYIDQVIVKLFEIRLIIILRSFLCKQTGCIFVVHTIQRNSIMTMPMLKLREWLNASHVIIEWCLSRKAHSRRLSVYVTSRGIKNRSCTRNFVSRETFESSDMMIIIILIFIIRYGK